MQRTLKSLLLAIVIVSAAIGAMLMIPYLLFGFGRKQPPHFVEGPETSNLSNQAHGCLLICQGWDAAEPNHPGIVAISLPDRKQTMVRRCAVDHLDIARVSGPDRRGLIAFVTTYENTDSWYSLRTIHIDGSNEKEMFRRKGDILWDHCMGEHLALSSVGGLVAFIGKGPSDQNPGALFGTGPIEIWDVNTATGNSIGIVVLDEPLWWFPDGKKLIYVTLIPRNKIPDGDTLPGSPYGQAYEKKYGRWDRYPAVFALDIETRRTHFLLPGLSPVLSTDGRKLMTKSGDKWLLFDINTHEVQSLDPPPQWGMPSFLLPGGLALFESLPTQGATPRWLKTGSFRAGTQMPCLKLGKVGTWQFQTIMPYIDFRDPMSFGTTSEKQPKSNSADAHIE